MEKELIDLPDASLEYYPHFFVQKKSDQLYERLMTSLNWQQDRIWLFGKHILQPRLTAFYGESGKNYRYSGLEMKPEAFTSELIFIKEQCEKYTGENFNVCLANLYRDGTDSMGWHADDEKELGAEPVIASVSLGAERFFHLKHKTNPTLKHKIRLLHGSLLIMKGTTQKFWKHQLPKTKKIVYPRINLTFRKVFKSISH